MIKLIKLMYFDEAKWLLIYSPIREQLIYGDRFFEKFHKNPGCHGNSTNNFRLLVRCY